MPIWSLQPIDNEIVPNIQDFKGKPLLILFFNLGCPGCKGRALPYENRVVVEHGDKVNVVDIHTRFEGPEYTKAHFEKAKEDYYIRFPFYIDANLADTFQMYNAGGTPHWILVDKEGNLEYSIFGSDPNNALLRLDFKINELLSNSI
jgi:thiol-disulfide isomerase/thioredoxin